MRRSPLWRRLAAEFVVIVLGVLVALAADRWNQDRIEADLEAAYLVRFEAEIRADSARAADYLETLPAIMAARDSLLRFVDGSPPPPELAHTILLTIRDVTLPPPATWDEVLSTNSLLIIQDPEVREAISNYYGTDRAIVQRNFERADRRGRDPFVEALYPLGMYQACVNESDCVSLGPRAGPDSVFQVRQTEANAFAEFAGMRELLLGLGMGHGTQQLMAQRIMGDASRVLEVLP